MNSMPTSMPMKAHTLVLLHTHHAKTSLVAHEKSSTLYQHEDYDPNFLSSHQRYIPLIRTTSNLSCTVKLLKIFGVICYGHVFFFPSLVLKKA